MPSSTILASLHVLGSRSGYTTVACSSVTPESLRTELESMDWWQDQVPHPAPSELLGSPTAWVQFHQVDNQAFVALRRVMPDANMDFAGRRTLIVVTLLLQESDYVRLARCLDGRSGKGLESIVWDNERWQHWASLRGVVTESIPLEFDEPEHDPLTPMPLTRVDVRIWGASYPRLVRKADAPSVVLASSPGTDASIVRLAAKLAEDHTARFEWGIRFAGRRTLGTASYMAPNLAPEPCVDLRDQRPSSQLEEGTLLMLAALPKEKWIPESRCVSEVKKRVEIERHAHQSKQRQLEAARDKHLSEKHALQVEKDTLACTNDKIINDNARLTELNEKLSQTALDPLEVVCFTTVLGSLVVSLTSILLSVHLHQSNDAGFPFVIGLLVFVLYLALAAASWLGILSGRLPIPGRHSISCNVIPMLVSGIVIVIVLMLNNSSATAKAFIETPQKPATDASDLGKSHVEK